MAEVQNIKSAFAATALAFTAHVEKLEAELAAERSQAIAERARWEESYASLKASYDNEFANTERLLEEFRALGVERARRRLK